MGGRRRFGGRDVDDDDAFETAPAAEVVDVLGDQAGDLELGAGRGRGAQFALQGVELIGHGRGRPGRQHPGRDQVLDLLVEGDVADVVTAERQVGQGRQRGTGQLGHLGDTAERLGQPGP